jgi:hypothetical protein
MEPLPSANFIRAGLSSATTSPSATPYGAIWSSRQRSGAAFQRARTLRLLARVAKCGVRWRSSISALLTQPIGSRLFNATSRAHHRRLSSWDRSFSCSPRGIARSRTSRQAVSLRLSEIHATLVGSQAPRPALRTSDHRGSRPRGGPSDIRRLSRSARGDRCMVTRHQVGSMGLADLWKSSRPSLHAALGWRKVVLPPASAPGGMSPRWFKLADYSGTSLGGCLTSATPPRAKEIPRAGPQDAAMAQATTRWTSLTRARALASDAGKRIERLQQPLRAFGDTLKIRPPGRTRALHRRSRIHFELRPYRRASSARDNSSRMPAACSWRR